MNEFAPISISTYSRLRHLQRTVEALKNNIFSEKCILYIFSDAPKKGDEIIVGKVREYLDTIDGFKEVHIIKQEVNSYEKNIKDAYSIPIEKHGKFIKMEDDIVTSPYFIKFMNEALEFYKDNKSIFAISGYTPAVNFHNNLSDDVFLSKDFSAWGYASWMDRGFIRARERLDYYDAIKRDKKLVSKINNLHPFLMDVLLLIQKKRTNPGDGKLSANLHLNDLFVVKPKVSMVKNIGFDGSGNAALNKCQRRFGTNIDPLFCPSLVGGLCYSEYYDEKIFKQYFGGQKIHILKRKFKNRGKAILNDSSYAVLKRFVKFIS